MRMASSIALAAFQTQNQIRADPLSIAVKVHQQIGMFDTTDKRTLTDKNVKTKEGITVWQEAHDELAR